MGKRRYFNIGFRVPPYKEREKVEMTTVTISRLAHDDVADYARKNNLLLRDALHQIIAKVVLTEKGYEVE